MIERAKTLTKGGALPPSSGEHEAALRFLDERTDYERSLAMPYSRWGLKLQRMRDLLARLGEPQQCLPILHVAGTKGKGSTAAMVAAVLTAAGYRTGLFTSPHLDSVHERIALDGRPCTPAELVQLVDRVRPAVAEIDAAAADEHPADGGPTFFEITTAMALLHFAARHAHAAVLEVGLGGRLDSTNVCRPLISVITSISFDHTQQLGNTLEAIAREKAGIVKPGVPVVSGVLDPGPREVIRRTCRRRRSPLIELGVDFDFHYEPPRNLDSADGLGRLDFQQCGRGGRRRHYAHVPLRLLGRHQAANAAVALAAIGGLQDAGWAIPEEAIRGGLGGTSWPVRVELVSRRPAVVIDGAHNVASVEALIRVLDESFSPQRRFLLFATTRQKDICGMLRCLLPHFHRTILTQYLNNPRAVPVEELAAAARELTGEDYPAYQDPIRAWKAVRALASPEDLICVTGSFYIAAQIRKIKDEG
jgi:dihydrofolate synthase/folylpolyglutamate synthase